MKNPKKRMQTSSLYLTYSPTTPNYHLSWEVMSDSNNLFYRSEVTSLLMVKRSKNLTKGGGAKMRKQTVGWAERQHMAQSCCLQERLQKR